MNPEPTTEFQRRSREAWVAAVAATVGPAPPEHAEWTDLFDMEKVLRPFLAGGISHAHLPTRGTLEFSTVTLSVEDDCLEIGLNETSLVVLKPRRLRLEHVSHAPAESFFLIECADLRPALEGSPTGIEEVCDLGGGEYLARHHWDENAYEGRDEDGEVETRPLPEDAKFVRRILRGTILLVCKGSRWNRSGRTGSGEHSGLEAGRIREIISAMGGAGDPGP